MKKMIVAAMMLVVLLCGMTVLHAIDFLSDEGVKCTFTHYDMWKGKMGSEGMLFLGIYGEKEGVYIGWGKNRDDLVQKDGFSLNQIDREKEKESGVPPSPPWYQEFTDMLKKAVEWEATADANGLEDVHKPIALGWAYHKLKKGSPSWISKTWGPDGKYELIEMKVSEIPKLLNILDEVPGMAKKLQEDNRKLKEESDRKKAEEKAKKDNVDNLLK